jgi:Ca2+-binding EF-hand superfamily protein
MKESGLNPTKAELKDMIKKADPDRTGTIDFEDFLPLVE